MVVQRDLSAKIAVRLAGAESEPGHGAARQEIAEWLEKLVMAEYVHCFAQQV